MQVQAESHRVVSIRGRKARFIWSSTPRKPVKGSIDFVARVDVSELLWIAKSLNCTVNGGKILVPDIDSYNRLLLYSAVRPTVRDRSKAVDLALLILSLSVHDVHYWASAVRSVWWRYGRGSHVSRVARAFKVFFNLS